MVNNKKKSNNKYTTEFLITSQKRSYKNGIKNRMKKYSLDRDYLIKVLLDERKKYVVSLHSKILDYSKIYFFQAYNYLLLHANISSVDDGNDIESKHIDYLINVAYNWVKLRHNEEKLRRKIITANKLSFTQSDWVKDKIKGLGFSGDDLYSISYSLPENIFSEFLGNEIRKLKDEIIGSYYFTGIPEISRMVDYINGDNDDNALSFVGVLYEYFLNLGYNMNDVIRISAQKYLDYSLHVGVDFAHRKGESSPAPIAYFVENNEFVYVDLAMISLLYRFAIYNTKESKKNRANNFESIIRKVGIENDWEVEDFKVEFPRLPKDMHDGRNPNVTEVDIILCKNNKHLLIETKNWGIWASHFLKSLNDRDRTEMLKSSAKKMVFRRHLYASKKGIDEKMIDLVIVTSIKENIDSIENIRVISIDELPNYLRKCALDG